MRSNKVAWEEVEEFIREKYKVESVVLLRDDGHEIDEYPEFLGLIGRGESCN